ncbi:uncharacterized protein LOC120528661 [Polypterus senegalus]|uniref:uncharacterized protein LOC120528661 n=1 Tax=Polypterus senegalus TaxID=55291 RepID=UPI0019668477|nr:uncharacterized protein LOC120528661 [Polypterus senegalus]
MMWHVLAISLLLIAQLHNVLTKSHYTSLGSHCVSACKLSNTHYVCTGVQQDGHYASMYCSPQEGVDYQGRKCRQDKPCNKYDKDYYWCYVEGQWNEWGYCGEVKEFLEHLTATYHIPCQNKCDKHGSTSYYWCNTRKGWDYCSPKPGLSIYGNKCYYGHPCEYSDKSKKSTECYLENGNWEICGKVHERDLVYVSSSYKLVCQDECSTYHSGYYWCHTLKGWDYCSPSPDVTFRKKQCSEDHKCGLNGESYYWCRTETSWNSCGPVVEGECVYTTASNFLLNTELICTTGNGLNTRHIRFEMQAATELLDGTPYLETAINLIARWHNGLLQSQNRTNLIKEGNLSIDLHESVVSEVHYYNLQIRVNFKSVPKQGTTISEILIPIGKNIPEKYFRRAFSESILRQAPVKLMEVQ